MDCAGLSTLRSGFATEDGPALSNHQKHPNIERAAAPAGGPATDWRQREQAPALHTPARPRPPLYARQLPPDPASCIPCADRLIMPEADCTTDSVMTTTRCALSCLFLALLSPAGRAAEAPAMS